MITAMHRQLDTSDEERLQTQLLSAQCRRRQFETVLSEIELKFRLAAPSHRPRPTTHGNFVHFEQVMQQQTAEPAVPEEEGGGRRVHPRLLLNVVGSLEHRAATASRRRGRTT